MGGEKEFAVFEPRCIVGPMKRLALAVGGALILAGGIALARRWGTPKRNQTVAPSVTPAAMEADPRGTKMSSGANSPVPLSHQVRLTPAEKAARVEKIQRDYDEIRAKIGADYTAAGALYPESVPAFLRQLALLEREKRADLAKVLTTEEFEELEWRETAAGKRVRELLDDTGATDAQRSAVFRLQRDYDERFALSFDVTPSALWERETARQETQEKIRLVLRDALFAAWLRGDGEAYAMFSDYVARKNLPGTVALELWRIRNDYTRQQLGLRADMTATVDQKSAAQAALAEQTEARVAIFVGREAVDQDRAGILGWLPAR